MKYYLMTTEGVTRLDPYSIKTQARIAVSKGNLVVDENGAWVEKPITWVPDIPDTFRKRFM